MILTVLLLLSIPLIRSRYISDVYPTSIPKYEVRIDYYTNKTVQTGLIHTLPPKSKLSEFNRHLQCPRTQPNFNYNDGVVSMLRMSPPTAASIRLMCALIESKCESWDNCLSIQHKYEAGGYSKEDNFNCINPWSRAHLYRVINGQMKLDWPWGVDRFDNKTIEDNVVPLIKLTLDRISDMRDSVFFSGGDTPAMSNELPFPIFAFATSDPYADMVFPWYEMWQDANRVYKKIRAAKMNFTNEAFEMLEVGYLSWSKRVPKAAYFATNQGLIRQFMFDVARLHPDMFDAGFVDELSRTWNPESEEDSMPYEDRVALARNATAVAASQSLPAGYAEPLANLSSFGKFIRYHPGSYKYVVVPLSDGLSTSARLHRLLASSGAVIFIQRSRTKFHFDALFKPWVHYVPLSYTGADIGEKVRWLREHDDMARQIAENGRNFARSHLRLEDYYCYAAAALDMMAELTGGTDAANTTFNAVDLPPLRVNFGDKSAYEYPM